MKRLVKALQQFLILSTGLFPTQLLMGQSNNPHAEAINRYHTSPKAAEIFKHGNVPVNLSSGQVQYGIPIYSIQVGNFQWPIGLNYAYNGLLLEAKPSEVGLGWNLSGGGAVVRQVRGLPDEHMRGYWGSSSRRSYIESFVNPGDIPLTIVKDFVSGLYDSEPDKFSVNAGSLNVSFYLSGTNDPGGCPFQAIVVTPNQENAKICFSWQVIEVTDANGVKYTFDAIEQNSFSSSHFENMEQMQNYPSAWQLSQITLLNGDLIEFGYDSKTMQAFSHSETLNRTASALGETIAIDCASLGGTSNTNYQSVEHFKELSYSKSYSASMIDARYLTDISWNEGSIVFERNGGESNIEVPRVSAIQIRDTQKQAISDFQLLYDNSQGRTLLKKVVRNEEEHYQFTYNPVYTPYITQPHTGSVLNPGQNPYAQDFWGFANGQANPSAIPEKGGKRMPKFTVASQGALTKIVYPTGGRTEIVYEPNQVQLSHNDFIAFEPDAPNQNFSASLVNPPLNQPFQKSYSITFNKSTFAKISHGGFVKGTSSYLNLSFGPDETPCNCETYYSYAPQQRLLYPERTPQFRPSFGLGLTGDNIQPNCAGFTSCDIQSDPNWILISPGTYTLEVSGYNAEALSYYLYIDYYLPTPANSDYHNVDAAGIRVAKTLDCDETTGCIEKNYKYVLEDGLSSGVYLSKIDYQYSFHIYDAHDCRIYSEIPAAPLFFPYDMQAISYNFRTLNSLEFSGGSPVYYNRVETISGDGTKTGKEVKYFQNSTYGFTGLYPYVPLPHNPINGAVWKAEAFKYASGFEKLTETEFLQAVQSPALNLALFPDGLVFGIANEYRYTPLWDANYFMNILETEGYLYNKYEVEKPTKLLVLNEKNSFLPEGFITETTNTYNNRLQQTTTTVRDSKGSLYKTKSYYPPDILDPGYAELVAINNISVPIKTEKYKDDALQESSQIFFQKWFTAPKPIVEPVRVEVTRGGNTTVEASMIGYTSRGKIKEFLPISGVRSSLFWGHNQTFPIASVTGAASNEIFFTSFETDEGNSNVGNSLVGESHAGSLSRTNFTYTLSGLTPGKNYILSYWKKETVGWVLNTVNVQLAANVTSYQINLTGQVDDVRFYPVGAQMITYTYKPLVGVTSISDPSNQIQYYEYDLKGRLNVVRDANKYIVQHTNYHYVTPPQN